jgi:hypothetical protein
MKNLFNKSTLEEVTTRLNNLTPQSQRKWGKMDVAQMLAHCKEAFKVPLMQKSPPRILIGILLGWIMKSKLYNETPWKQNLPTAPQFIIKDERNFEQERTALLNLINQFHNDNPERVATIVHPMFGKYTGEQWGKSMYKHLDHHLMQFGV